MLVVLAGMSTPPSLSDLVSAEVRLSWTRRPACRRPRRATRPDTAPDDASGALTRHTGGNPRDVLALLDEVPAEVWSRPDAPLPAPAHVRDRIRDQLDRATPRAGRSSRRWRSSVTRPPSPRPPHWRSFDEPLAAVDTASAAGLLSDSVAGTPRLRDPLTRAAVIDLMGLRRVADQHRRAAEIVTDPVRRLGHRVAATPTPDPDSPTTSTGWPGTTGTEGAWAQAATLFRDAARLTADELLRDERLTRSVDALVAAGDLLEAAAQVPAVENLRETPLRNAVLAYLAILRGRATEAQIRLGRAWDIVNVERDPDTAALIAQRHVLHSLVRCRGDELVAWADRALELADSDSPAGIEAAAIRGLGLSGRRPSADAPPPRTTSSVAESGMAPRPSGSPWGGAGCSSVRDDVDGARSPVWRAPSRLASLGGSRANHAVGVGLAGAGPVRDRRVGPGDDAPSSEGARWRPPAGSC